MMALYLTDKLWPFVLPVGISLLVIVLISFRLFRLWPRLFPFLTQGRAHQLQRSPTSAAAQVARPDTVESAGASALQEAAASDATPGSVEDVPLLPLVEGARSSTVKQPLHVLPPVDERGGLRRRPSASATCEDASPVEEVQRVTENFSLHVLPPVNEPSPGEPPRLPTTSDSCQDGVRRRPTASASEESRGQAGGESNVPSQPVGRALARAESEDGLQVNIAVRTLQQPAPLESTGEAPPELPTKPSTEKNLHDPHSQKLKKAKVTNAGGVPQTDSQPAPVDEEGY